MTRKSTPTLTLCLLLTSIPLPALAQESGSSDTSQEKVSPLTGTIDFGFGNVSDDSYRFGRYTGLHEEGLFLVGAFDVHFRPGRPDFLHLQGGNLGLDSRWLSLEYGEQGRFETLLEYRELPHFTLDSGVTPYQGVGGDTLTLAPGASLDELLPLSLDTKRERLKAGVGFFPQERWKTSLTVSHEKKDGADWIGGALLARPPGMGPGGGISPGRSYAVVLPEPIDQTTTEIDAALDYNGERSQWRLNLHGSLFNNGNSALRWDEPGFTPPGRQTLPSAGQLALPPDNRFFQLALSGSTQVSETTRFTGVLSAGLMQQDDDFLPYGIDGSAAATAALPRSSLDGEVYLYSARAALTSRPIRPLRLTAQYRYDERDDQTSSATYLYDGLDSGIQAPNAVTNEARSYRKHKAGLDADYRFSSAWKGSLGYAYDQIERDYSDVEESSEHSGSARLNWRPRDDLDATVRLGTSSREASEYQAVQPNQNPLLRKYNVADRDRDTAGILLSYAPTDQLNLGFSADMRDDDYTDSSVGLTEGDSVTYNLDVGYRPTENLQFSAFYTYDRIESQQIGDTGAALYEVDFDDQVDTLGLSADLTDLWRGWDLGLRYTYSNGTGEIEHSGVPYPTLKNEMQRVELSAATDLNPAARLKLAVIYESLDAEDWALDGFSATPTNGLLTLGNESEDYDVVAFLVALQYRF